MQQGCQYGCTNVARNSLAGNWHGPCSSKDWRYCIQAAYLSNIAVEIHHTDIYTHDSAHGDTQDHPKDRLYTLTILTYLCMSNVAKFAALLMQQLRHFTQVSQVLLLCFAETLCSDNSGIQMEKHTLAQHKAQQGIHHRSTCGKKHKALHTLHFLLVHLSLLCCCRSHSCLLYHCNYHTQQWCYWALGCMRVWPCSPLHKKCCAVDPRARHATGAKSDATQEQQTQFVHHMSMNDRTKCMLGIGPIGNLVARGVKWLLCKLKIPNLGFSVCEWVEQSRLWQNVLRESLHSHWYQGM